MKESVFKTSRRILAMALAIAMVLCALPNGSFGGLMQVNAEDPETVTLTATDFEIGENFTYTGKVIDPVKITQSSQENGVTEDLYTVSYEKYNSTSDQFESYTGNLIDVGKYKVIVTANSDSTEITSKEIEVVQLDLEKCIISLDQSSYTYTGNNITPNVTVKLNDDVTVIDSSVYDVSYAKKNEDGTYGDAIENINEVGKYKLMVTRKEEVSDENCAETRKVEDDKVIVSSLDFVNCKIVVDSSYTYTGSNIEPNIKVSDADDVTLNAQIYGISYKDAEENNVTELKTCGSYTVIVTIRDEYKSNLANQDIVELETNIEIVQIDLSNASISIEDDSFVYDKTSQSLPKITITLNDETIDSDNYEVAYKKQNEDGDYSDSASETTSGVGTYKVVITGKDNYKGSIEGQTFKITPASIATYEVNIDPESYVIATKQPNVIVKKDSVTLVLDQDYTVDFYKKKEDDGYSDQIDFLNNINEAGTYYVVINGIGNYTGQIEKEYEFRYAIETTESYSITGDRFDVVNYPKFYHSDVTIKASEGYSASKDLKDGYSDSITYDSIVPDTYFYVKNTNNGEISKVKADFTIDKTAPTMNFEEPSSNWSKEKKIIKVTNVEDDNGIYGVYYSTQDILVNDTGTVAQKNLSELMEAVKANDGYQISVDEELDVQGKTYYIYVVDNAGNYKKEEVKVSQIDKTAPSDTIYVQYTSDVSESSTGIIGFLKEAAAAVFDNKYVNFTLYVKDGNSESQYSSGINMDELLKQLCVIGIDDEENNIELVKVVEDETKTIEIDGENKGKFSVISGQIKVKENVDIQKSLQLKINELSDIAGNTINQINSKDITGSTVIYLDNVAPAVTVGYPESNAEDTTNRVKYYSNESDYETITFTYTEEFYKENINVDGNVVKPVICVKKDGEKVSLNEVNSELDMSEATTPYVIWEEYGESEHQIKATVYLPYGTNEEIEYILTTSYVDGSGNQLTLEEGTDDGFSTIANGTLTTGTIVLDNKAPKLTVSYNEASRLVSNNSDGTQSDELNSVPKNGYVAYYGEKKNIEVTFTIEDKYAVEVNDGEKITSLNNFDLSLIKNNVEETSLPEITWTKATNSDEYTGTFQLKEEGFYTWSLSYKDTVSNGLNYENCSNGKVEGGKYISTNLVLDHTKPVITTELVTGNLDTSPAASTVNSLNGKDYYNNKNDVGVKTQVFIYLTLSIEP